MNHRMSFLSTATGLIAFVFITMTAVGSNNAAAAGSPVDFLKNRTSSLQPISLAGISISNFGVVDGHIYRGEQPAGKDYSALAAIGVKTIIDLRDDAKSTSKRDAQAAGLRYINIAIDGHGTPTDAQAAEFLKDIDDPGNGVVYVHCAGGRHRTGSMIAIYRMVEDGWTIDQAYKEMLAYDFYTGGGHGGFKTYVYSYYNRMTSDVSSVPVAFHIPAPDKTDKADKADNKEVVVESASK
jgi:protein-tyrosine phosphatase